MHRSMFRSLYPRPTAARSYLLWLALTFSILASTGCAGEQSQQPAETNKSPGSTKVNAVGTLNLAHHTQTIHHIMDESLALLPLLSSRGIAPSASATDEQKQTLKRVASPFALGEAKDPVLQYDIWMNELSHDQAKELSEKLDGLQAWIDEMKSCYPFAGGPNLASVKKHVANLENNVKAIKSDLPK